VSDGRGREGERERQRERGRGRGRERERDADGLIHGRIRVHPAGYGFVERDDGEEDVFVAARERGLAMDGDRVAVVTWPGYKGTEGRVETVLARGRAKLTGTLRLAGRHATLEPDDPRVQGTVALPEGAGGAHEGQAVVAEILRYPEAAGQALVARVLTVLGDPDDPRTEVAKVILCADIPDAFSDESQMAAARAPREVGPEDLVDRVDLRDRDFVTCDPETARDFDDAVCVEPGVGAGWRLWVAVADVSHYVRAGSALDREARARGCSVYLPDRAIPMLPHELSAGICSLNPEVDRLAMVCRLDVSPSGEVADPTICAAVIRSRARLDYAGTAAALAGDFRGPRARYRDHLAHLERMAACAARLRARREARGALDFNLEQAVVVLDDDDPRRVRDVRRSKPSEEIKRAYGIVEDFMLAANEAVAAFFHKRGLDAVWRVHDKPDERRIEEFATFAEAYGVALSPAQAADPRELRQVVERLRGMPAERALSFLLLRSLKQASYDVVNIGHYGLAASDYVHFTSPIRRYPDLIVHRLLKRQLHLEGLPGGGRNQPTPPARAVLAEMAAESSAHERRAMEAEREVVDMYRAHLMRERVGDELDGTITGVASFGFFVSITEPFVEGLVRIAELGRDFYDFDAERLRIVGRRSGRAFALGDPVRVRVASVSVARRRIELALAGTAREGATGELPTTRAETRKRSRRPHGGPRRTRPEGGRRGRKGPRRAR
jgi:ribonuclease R